MMKNSKASDRKLSQVLGVSQPTISRTRARLEKEGYIKAYTLMPNLQKIGYSIIATNTICFKEVAPVRAIRADTSIVFAIQSFGKSHILSMISIHKTYDDYRDFCKKYETGNNSAVLSTKDIIKDMAVQI